MIDDIRGEALELQLKKAESGQVSLDVVLKEAIPSDSTVKDLIPSANYVASRLEPLEKVMLGYALAIGRIMHLARARPKDEWEGTEYAHFTDFQSKVLGGTASNGSRFAYMKIYEELGGFKMEEIQGIPMGNLKEVARISKVMKASPNQKQKMLEIAKNHPESDAFRAGIEQGGFMAPGDAFAGSFTITGPQGRVHELKEWLDREDGLEVGYVDKLLLAAAEFDSTGPAAVRASILLKEVTECVQKHGGLTDDLEKRVFQWYRETNPGEVVPVTEYETQEPE